MTERHCVWPERALRESIDWYKYKDVFHRLYIIERRTLKEVKQIMEADHGFSSSLRLYDYETALRDQLELRKNLKPVDWKSIAYRINKRRRMNKESSVWFHNVEMQRARVVRESRRYLPKKALEDLIMRANSPPLASGILITTPPPYLPGSPQAEFHSSQNISLRASDCEVMIIDEGNNFVKVQSPDEPISPVQPHLMDDYRRRERNNADELRHSPAHWPAEGDTLEVDMEACTNSPYRDGGRSEIPSISSIPTKYQHCAPDTVCMDIGTAHDLSPYSSCAPTALWGASDACGLDWVEWEAFDIPNPIQLPYVNEHFDPNLSRLRQRSENTPCLGVASSQQLVSDLLAVLIHASRDDNSTAQSMWRPRSGSWIHEKPASRDQQLSIFQLWQSRIQHAPGFRMNSIGDNVAKRVAPLPGRSASYGRQTVMSINTAMGVFTVQASGPKILGQHSTESLLREGSLGHSQISGLSFKPKRGNYAINLSFVPLPTPGDFLPSIPHLTIHPVLPLNSTVFSLARQGRVSELLSMLQDGKASLWDHDDHGYSLLHHSALADQPEMCLFLISRGLDVDEVTTDDGSTPLRLCFWESQKCAALLLEHGADPTIPSSITISPFWSACHSSSDSMVPLIYKHSQHFVGETETEARWGLSPFLSACRTFPGSETGFTRAALSILLASGSASIEELAHTPASIESNYWNVGSTCLHICVANAWKPEQHHERDGLIYLIQQGANVRAEDAHGATVSEYAYRSHLLDGHSTGHHEYQGGYRGDLWDVALVSCGYDLYEFRKDYPRWPRYGPRYTRDDFEALWAGYEALCPYWDDGRYPASGGDSDFWHPDENWPSSEEESGSDYDDGDAMAEEDGIGRCDVEEIFSEQEDDAGYEGEDESSEDEKYL